MPPRAKLPNNQKSGEYAIEERRKRVADLYRQGRTQWQIAIQLREEGYSSTLSASTISNDLKAVMEEWRKEAKDSIEEMKMKELAKINLLEETAWEQYLRSCQDAQGEIVRIEKGIRAVKQERDKANRARKQKGNVAPKQDEEQLQLDLVPVKETVERYLKGRLGDPRYFETVRWCIEFRCKLMGVITEKGPTNNIMVLPPDFWENITDRPKPGEDSVSLRMKAILNGEPNAT